MKSFYKTMGYLAGIFFLIIILSVTVIKSYMDANSIPVKEIFETIDNDWNIVYSSAYRRYDEYFDYAKYETKKIDVDYTSPLVDHLVISTINEDIEFIKENREDIYIEYSRTYPVVNNFSIDFSPEHNNDTLRIELHPDTSYFHFYTSYDATLKIHVPIDYRFKSIEIANEVADLHDTAITATDRLQISANVGNVDLDIPFSLSTFSLSQTVGDANIHFEETVDDIDVQSDTGSLILRVEKAATAIHATLDIGDLELTTKDNVKKIVLINNLGLISLDANKYINEMEITNDIGSIEIELEDNKDFTIYAVADLGSVDSEFPLTQNKTTANYIIENSLGSIKIED